MSVTAAITPNAVLNHQSSSNDPQLMTDERLVKKARIGHRGAFDELYKRHREKMFRVTHRITRNRQDAEDAVQDCFLSAYLHVRSFDNKARFSTWLTRIAINAALMKLRKNLASREVHMEEHLHPIEGPEHQMPDSSPSPEERYAQGEQERLVREAISKLRPEMRNALEIQLQDCSIAETAKNLGISLTTAKARVFRARTVLRRHYRRAISLKIRKKHLISPLRRLNLDRHA
jgi:RNA polymerase sigma factor (sigma-70 family)